MSRPCPHASAERGAASVLGLAVTGVLVSLLLGLAVVAAAVEAGHRAAAAADLAALAGAQAVQRGRDGCAAAHPVARANGATVTRCRRAGDDVEVHVAARVVPVAGLRALPRVVRRARAGP